MWGSTISKARSRDFVQARSRWERNICPIFHCNSASFQGDDGTVISDGSTLFSNSSSYPLLSGKLGVGFRSSIMHFSCSFTLMLSAAFRRSSVDAVILASKQISSNTLACSSRWSGCSTYALKAFLAAAYPNSESIPFETGYTPLSAPVTHISSNNGVLHHNISRSS